MAKTYKCLKEVGYVINGHNAWTASTAYTTSSWVRPTTPNGFVYECTVAGTSGGSEPSWGTTPGVESGFDGTAKWTCRAITPTYTVPASTVGYIGKIRLNNTTSNSVNASINLVPNSTGSVGIANRANTMWNIQLEPWEQVVFGDAEFPDILGAENDTLQIFGSVKDAVTCRVSGIEET